MATLAIAAGGALIGGVVGAEFGYAALGLSLGWMVGSVAGAVLFPQHQKPTKSGQIGDNSLQISTYGVVIPRIYGAARLAGNVIWANQRNEHKSTKTEGGKGMGGGAKTITYTYSQSFAIGICQGPISGIRKIWADGKLIKDLTAVSPSSSDTNTGGAFAPNIYLGDDTQEPDPVIEAAMGIDNVPAYRGLAYIVARDFALTDWGNRIPNFTFEVVRGASALPAANYLVAATTAARSVEPYGGLWWVANGTTIYGINPYTTEIVTTLDVGGETGVWLYKIFASDTGPLLYTVTPDDYGLYASISYFDYAGPVLDPSTGEEIIPPRVLAWCNGPIGSNSTYASKSNEKYCLMAVIDARTGVLLAKTGFDIPGNFFGEGGDSYLWYVRTGPGEVIGQMLYMYSHSSYNGDTVLMFDCSAGVPAYIDRGPQNVQDTYWWTNTTIKLPLPDLTDSTRHLVLGMRSSDNVLVLYVNAAVADTLVIAGDYAAPCWDYIHQILYVTSGAAANHVFTAYSLDGNVFTSLQSFTVTSHGTRGISGLVFEPITNQIVIIDDPYVVGFDANWQVSENTDQLYAYSSVPPISSSDPAEPGRVVFVPQCNDYVLGISGNQATRIWITPRITQDFMTLDECVADACSLTNLEDGDYAVDTLSSQTVYGYSMTNQAACRSMIEDWVGAYFFDIVQSDDKIKFLLRPQAKVADLTMDDLVIAGGQTGTTSGADNSIINIQDTKENDLPRELDFIFIDPNITYQQNCARSRRLTTKSRNTKQSNIPLVFSSANAAPVAEKMMSAVWAERRQYSFSLSQKWSWLDPADVITLTTDNLVHTLRLTRVAMQPGNVLQCEAVSMQALAYQHSQAGPAGAVYGDPLVSVALASTVLYILDTPLLRDQDEGSIIYLAVGHGSGAWTGAGVFKSADDANYSVIETFNTEGAVGTAAGALMNVTDPYIWDNGPALSVKLTDPEAELVSTTDDEVLNGANPMLVGDEIIQYRDAILQADGSYLISRRLRGRRGTEYAMVGHTVGERVVALSTDTLKRDTVDLSERNQLRYYKGVTFNAAIQSALAMPFAFQANSLKPYSPCHIEGSRDGSDNLTITWVRRSRLSGAWMDYIDVPLGETSEAYEVDVMDGLTVKRTLSSTSPSVAYTAAQQTADGFTPGQTINVNVYQLSSLVGRGFAGVADV